MPAARLATLIAALVRAHAANTPPPRGLPYLGLEHPSGTGLHLLDALAARGIFRKYEYVLDIGAGLGATSRWLAARLGCEVVGTAATEEEAAAATELTRRVGLALQVHAIPARGDALPFRDGKFTHVWIIEALPRVADPDAVLREAHRALRPGGTLAVQDLVAGEGPPPVLPTGWRLASLAERTEALSRLGYVDVVVRDRSADAPERAAQVVAARERFVTRCRAEPALAGVVAEREAIAPAVGSGALRVVQLLARRA